jgi:hypothetical protein
MLILRPITLMQCCWKQDWTMFCCPHCSYLSGNIEQYCYTRFRLKNIVQYCWQLWTTWAAKHCSVLLSNGLGVFCRVHRVGTIPCEQSPLVFLLGTATEKRERLCRTCVYSLWSRQSKNLDNLRNFRFDTGFKTGFDPNRKLLIKSSSGK